MHQVLKGNEEAMGFNTDDRKELQRIFKEGTPDEVAIQFSEKYEKPSEPHLDRRIETTNKLLNIID